MSEYIPLSVPSIKGNEWKYVKECLDTEWVSSAGKFVTKFEDDICNFTGSKFAIACMNGTAALQLAIEIIGVKPDDEVIVPTLTFIAPINTIAYIKAHPVFMDCDKYYNIDTEKVIDFIKNEIVFQDGFSYNKKTKRRISAIIPVHIFGNACDLEKLVPICREYNISIIEDATESLGTSYNSGLISGKYSGTIGDIGCFSFNGNKIITTGGGGMLVTNNEKYAEKARYLSTQAKDDQVRYIHENIGYNFRMTNIQAAIGVAQLEQIEKYIQIKKSNYQVYKKAINVISGLSLAGLPDYADNNHWFYALQIDEDLYGKSREEVMKLLLDNEIETRPVWYPNHIQKPYKNSQSYRIKMAYQLLKNTLNLPCSVNLTVDQIKKITNLLRNV